MRGNATIFKGDTFVEISAVYYITVLDDPRSFAEALRATETYIRSKINKGKGDVVGGPGGKLERLEAKYASLGFQDIFYLTRVNLGLPPSSLSLPPPSKKVRDRLVKAGFQVPDASGPERGRPTSVKDLSRPGSLTETPILGPQRTTLDGDGDGTGRTLLQLPLIEGLDMGRDKPWNGSARPDTSSTLSAALLQVASTHQFAQMPSNSKSRSTVLGTSDPNANPIIRSRPLQIPTLPAGHLGGFTLGPLLRLPLTPESSPTPHWSTASTTPDLALDMEDETARDPFVARRLHRDLSPPSFPMRPQDGSGPEQIKSQSIRASTSPDSRTPITRDDSPATEPSDSLVLQEEMARPGIRQSETSW